ncbi:MAG: NTP transferase domain-containing protein [Oscillospiraceae bacterium]|nr:NTP transferase domain-containing protein [Oscillospiraceae bacterium]
MKQPTLVIMAAGMGSRFGGPKQVTPVDEQGHIIIDFSLFDAYRAGFRRVAFIVNPKMEEAFRERLGDHIEKYFDVTYIHQTLDRLPEGYTVPENRVKPWGTGHAIACCKGFVDGPFAVINADDFYGPTAFSTVYDYLVSNTDESAYAMVGYRLRNTVTEHGSVARGVCEVENGKLTAITERTKIFKKGNDATFTEDGETFTDISGDTLVSMNLWGFSQKMLHELWARFPAFLDKNLPINSEKCEYFLPFVVDEQISEGTACVNVLPCEETWYGVTYREDLESVCAAIARMKAEGIYEEELWV